MTKVHQCRSAFAGLKASAAARSDDVSTVRISSSTTAFAMMSLSTQGVMRLEGVRFIELRL